MIVLDATNEILQMVLAAATTTNALEWAASYSDYVAGTPSFTPINSDGVSNGVTDVDIVGSPGGSTQRLIKFVAIYNKDTVPATVTVKIDRAAGTERIFCKFTLQPGDTLSYEDGEGFRCLDLNGNVKQVIATTGTFLKTTVILNGTTSFTTQPTTRTIFARGQAGGGGGGGVAGNAAGNGTVAGGGSAGGYFEKTLGVTGNTAYTVAVGAAGTAGASGGGTGGTGGITTLAVNGVTIQANGGLGGVNSATGVAAIFALGGASPAVSTNGDANSGGAPGNYGSLAAAGAAGCSGGGGSCLFGAGGNGNSVTGPGTAVVGLGGGGAGSLSLASGAAQAGLVGAAGILVIDEYA